MDSYYETKCSSTVNEHVCSWLREEWFCEPDKALPTTMWVSKERWPSTPQPLTTTTSASAPVAEAIGHGADVAQIEDSVTFTDDAEEAGVVRVGARSVVRPQRLVVELVTNELTRQILEQQCEHSYQEWDQKGWSVSMQVFNDLFGGDEEYEQIMQKACGFMGIQYVAPPHDIPCAELAFNRATHPEPLNSGLNTSCYTASRSKPYLSRRDYIRR